MTGPASTEPALPASADPRRWITLVIILTAVLMAALDSTVLNVAIPTILRDFETTLPRLQWVITGYSLTFAALLIIGGRLADIHGARRIFMIGAAIFGVGSLVAALSTGVVMLVVGEAIVEGIGASLMLPATLGILTSSFQGQERATAFAAWGAVLGVAVALGPVIGGFLTTYYSWRWAFIINVIVVPFAIAGAVIFMREAPRPERRERIDLPGALLVASGMLLLVFGISEGGTYGWWHPLESVKLLGVTVWSLDRPVAIVPIAFLAVRDPAHGVRAGRAREGALATRSALRVQHPAPARLPLRARDARGARDGPDRVPARDLGVPPGRPAPERGPGRPLADPLRRVHRDRCPDRRPPDPHGRHDGGGPGRPRVRGAGTRRHRPRRARVR